MKILIMRHGEAAFEGVSDAQRPLTAAGKDEVKLMAQWLYQQGVTDVDRILVSPYLRARQTLSVVKNRIGARSDSVELSVLRPSGNAQEVAAYLYALAAEGVETVLVISHLPLVGYLVAELCPNETPPMFATASFAQVEIDIESGEGQLLWQITPSQAKRDVVT